MPSGRNPSATRCTDLRPTKKPLDGQSAWEAIPEDELEKFGLPKSFDPGEDDEPKEDPSRFEKDPLQTSAEHRKSDGE